MHTESFAPPRWRRRLGLILAAGLALSQSGCFAIYYVIQLLHLMGAGLTSLPPRELIPTVTADHAAAGTSLVARVTWTANSPGRNMVHVSGPDGGIPENVTIGQPVPLTNDGSPFQAFDIPIDIAANAPARPLTIHVQTIGTTNSAPTVPFSDFGSVPFFIHAAGTADAPRLLSLSPREVDRGQIATVTLTGQGFTAASEVFVNTPGVAVTAVAFHSPTELVATLSVGANARTGSAPIVVRTAAGETTSLGPLIADPVAPPTVTALYPNHLEQGQRGTFALTGRGFATGQVVICDTPENLRITSPLQARDRFVASFTASASLTQGLQLLRVDSVSGTFGPFGLRLLSRDPYVRGPRLFSLFGRQNISPGARVQILLETNDRVESNFVVESIGVDGVPMHSAARLYGYTPIGGERRQFVLELEAAPASRPGPAGFALRRADGLTTDMMTIDVVEPPVTRPFVRKVSPSFIQRGTSGSFIVEGERLSQVRSVRFRSDGLTATVDQFSTDGTFFRGTFTATEDAELTGDTLTTFDVTTPQGTSNLGSIVVAP